MNFIASVQASGFYKKYIYAVVLLSPGHYCGFLKIEDKAYYEMLKFSIKNNCTFIHSCYNKLSIYQIVDGASKIDYLPNGYWIGFEFNCSDLKHVTSTEFYKKLYSRYNAKTAVEFLEKECQKMIDQLYRI